MNQDAVKDVLLTIEEAPRDFSVVFSGKMSKKVNGLYKCDSREIIIHNRNFTDDNLLIYTAIHEYAHHLHACSRGGTLSPRSHTAEFWAIFHHLLEKAETQGLYRNSFADSPELAALTETIRSKFLRENAQMIQELGRNLLEAFECCKRIGVRFEDYVDRVLCIPRNSATMAMKSVQCNLNPDVGPDNMRYLAGISNTKVRKFAESALLSGKSPDSVKIAVKNNAVSAGPDLYDSESTGEIDFSKKPLPFPAAEDPKIKLEREKQRLERTIASLSKRISAIDQALQTL